MQLPRFHSDNRELSMMQSQWAATLNPVIANPLNSCLILKNVSLIAGANTINHLLGHNLSGWMIVRQRAAASIFDTQDTNPQQNLTLTLTSDNPVTVDLAVF